MKQSLEDFVVPYPSRNHPNIQSLLYAKKEIRETVPDPDTSKGEYKLDDTYFNHQIAFQRIVSEYGSVLMLSGTGSGKTGCFSAFETFQRTHREGEIKDFWYVGGNDQQNDFKDQITRTFGKKEEQTMFSKGAAQETTQKRRMMKAHFITSTYNDLAKEIQKRSNEELLRDYGNSAFFFDEIHTLKLTEKTDTAKIRERLLTYQSIWRLTHVCNYAYFILVTATPITNDINEIIYHINLLPNTIQIETKLSKSIYNAVFQEHGVSQQQWMTVDFSIVNELDPDYLDHLQGIECTGEALAENYHPQDYTKRLDILESQLEKILRGRIIYVRSPSTGAVEIYPDSEYDPCCHRFLRVLEMSVFQSLAYADIIMKGQDEEMIKTKLLNQDEDNTTQKGNSLYQLPKQASVFVFPTKEYALKRLAGKESDIPGLVGSEGIMNLITLSSVDVAKKEEDFTTKGYYSKKTSVKGKKVVTMNVEDWFSDYLANDNLLYESSAKFYEIIKWLERNDTGMAYIAEEYYATNCLVFAAALQARPLPENNVWRTPNARWTPFELKKLSQWQEDGKITIGKAPRYIIYSSTTDEKIRAQALQLASHPANVKGEYIKAIIATEVGSVGININNGMAMFFNNCRFTPSATRQTKDRIFRARSHVAALSLAEKKGLDYVNVEVRYMVSQVNPKVQEMYKKRVPEIDALLYRVIYEKDFRFSKLMRMFKRIAIDAPVNVSRNIRSSDKARTEQCDYEIVCSYKPYNFDPTLPIDYSTYNVYYNEKSIALIKEFLVEMFQTKSGFPVNALIKYISNQRGHTTHEIANAIRYLVENNQLLLVDRFGYDQYLAENRGILYITREPFLKPEASLHYYSNIVLYESQSILEDYAAAEANVKEERKLIDSDQMNDVDEYKYWYANLDAYKKIKLFEEAWIELQENPDNEPLWAKRIRNCVRHLYAVDPVDGTPVHEIELVYSKTTNYNAVDGLLRPSGHLRVYRDGIWRHTNEYERDYYAAIISKQMDDKLDVYYRKFHAFGLIGVIVRPDLVHIREFTYNEKLNTYR